MSKKNLLSCLASNTTNTSRSNSLFSKNTLSPTFAFMPRSNSLHHNNPSSSENSTAPTPSLLFSENSQQGQSDSAWQLEQINIQKPINQETAKQLAIVKAKKQTILCKMSYLVNKKIKNTSFFVFCKLQQIYKLSKLKAKLSSAQIQSQKSIKSTPNSQASCNSIKHEDITDAINSKLQQDMFVQNKKYKRQNIQKGLSLLSDCFKTLSCKVVIRQKNVLSESFNHIIKKSQKVKGNCLIGTCLNDLIFKHKLSSFKTIQKLDNERMRCQILQISLKQLYQKNINRAFSYIRKFVNTTTAKINWKDSVCGNQFQLDFREAPLQKLNDFSSQLQFNQIAQKNSRIKKIVIRQKKITINKPINLSMIKYSKAVDVIMNQDKHIIHNNNFEDVNEMMHRLAYQNQEIMIYSVPDLNDNCVIFRQLPEQKVVTRIKSTFMYDNCISETKKSLQFFNDEKGDQPLTDRCRTSEMSIHYSKSARITPMNKHHKSVGTIVSKKSVTLQNYEPSPLIKIDQILNKIEQMKSYSSCQKIGKQKQKKMLNINLPKDFHQNYSNAASVKYYSNMKTPNKQRNQHELAQFRSDEKENFRQKLINDKQKLTSYKKSTNYELQAFGKYNNSTTLKSKGKNDKQQLFTARKMKMEIENIISRRNKQIASRNDPQIK